MYRETAAHPVRDDLDDPFFFAFETHVLQKALPAFEEACRFARDRGLSCTVELLTNDDGNPELCLLARQRDDLPHSSYRIIADPATQGIVHEEYSAISQRTRRVAARLASINTMVLDTQLAAFFKHAFDLRLDYAGERHGGGFW
ncbi:hypothetical protein D9M68_164130 [compost metagenome]|uniref:Uncharacterized protein n=1 Tax=Pseudomonas jinjuensis TaxID=198616 RepID=A0A1H0LHQ8_9PSED|nr:hypothetical protein [Pseudomonas jinjuensis]SDO67541.1 hypothetical protein SAMN05216193_11467 [Pseudomonas jinjuensis]